MKMAVVGFLIHIPLYQSPILVMFNIMIKDSQQKLFSTFNPPYDRNISSSLCHQLLHTFSYLLCGKVTSGIGSPKVDLLAKSTNKN
jgi:hypothetical protein